MQTGELKGHAVFRDSDDPQLLGYRNLVCAAVQLALDDLAMKRMSNLSKEKKLKRWASAAVWLADPDGAQVWCDLLNIDIDGNILKIYHRRVKR